MHIRNLPLSFFIMSLMVPISSMELFLSTDSISSNLLLNIPDSPTLQLTDPLANPADNELDHINPNELEFPDFMASPPLEVEQKSDLTPSSVNQNEKIANIIKRINKAEEELALLKTDLIDVLNYQRARRKRKSEESPEELVCAKPTQNVQPLIYGLFTNDGIRVGQCLSDPTIAIDQRIEQKLTGLIKRRGPSSLYKKRTLTILHLAVFLDKTPLVKQVLTRNPDPNIASLEEHITPLMTACANGNQEIVEALLAAKADTEPETPQGFTALSIALEKKHLKIASLLQKSTPAK